MRSVSWECLHEQQPLVEVSGFGAGVADISRCSSRRVPRKRPIQHISGRVCSGASKDGHPSERYTRRAHAYEPVATQFRPSARWTFIPWVRRVPLIAVLASVFLALLGVLLAGYWFASSVLEQMGIGHAHLMKNSSGVEQMPQVPDYARPRQWQSTLSSVTDRLGTSVRHGAQPSSYGTDAYRPSFYSGKAPARRLQNIVSIGPPEGYYGFDAQNMWEAFKAAPQDYLLLLGMVLNMLLASCFCSWLCSQRSYQKAVLVSP